MSIIQMFRTLKKLNISNQKSFGTTIAFYSRKSDSNNFDGPYKVVKSNVRIEDDSTYLGGECGPNWELLAPRGNRFYFPNSIGPAWQGISTTIALESPLENLVQFDEKTNNNLLTFSVRECPSLIKKNLHELFPSPEVISSKSLSILTLKYEGKDVEKGASKFVLAAREITSRLRLHGYWADFMNPYSGKPFYSWSSGKNLYKIDNRFRGIGMKLIKQNNCTIISSETDRVFSGSIFANVPSDLALLKTLISENI